MDVVEALEAQRGTTCVVGAGGKKTTMATLAAALERAVGAVLAGVENGGPGSRHVSTDRRQVL
ncbi:hypothetical protein [Natrinema zhouii]|uniref:hypothetical protein n=1 Tax=Natrinema zhouii TaxID=1710539 RepID=UPI001C610CE0